MAYVNSDPRPGAWWRWLLEVPGFLILVYSTLLYASAFASAGGGFVGMICCLAGLYLCIVLHEIGHAVAAWLVGWRVTLFAVRPFALHLPNRQIARMEPSEDEELGGYVFACPSRLSVATAGRKAILILGGPIANLAFGAWAVVTAFQWNVASGNQNPAMVAALFALGLQSLYVGLGALLPAALVGRSDGANLLALWRHHAHWRAVVATTYLHALSRYKVRLANQPQWMVEAAQVEAEAHAELLPGLSAIRIGRVLDSLPVDRARARQMLDEHRAHYGESEWLSYCDAYFSTVWEGRSGNAEALWQGAQDLGLEPLRLAAEASIAARAGDADTMALKLDYMDTELRRVSVFRDPTFQDIRHTIEALAR